MSSVDGFTLSPDIDTRNPTAKLMLTILAGVATWEREIMLERQREGIARAKGEGRYKGRQPTARRQEVLRLAAEGAKAPEIAAKLAIGRSSAFRILAAAKEPSTGLTGLA